MSDCRPVWVLPYEQLAAEIRIPCRNIVVAIDFDVHWCCGDYYIDSELSVYQGGDDESSEEPTIRMSYCSRGQPSVGVRR